MKSCTERTLEPASRRVKVKASVNSALVGLVALSCPSRGLAQDRLAGNRPLSGVYRSESEKEEGLVHLHTSISSPATRWDSVWIRDSLEAKNSTARSQTRFMRLLQQEGPGLAGKLACGCPLYKWGQSSKISHRIYLWEKKPSSTNRTPAERNFLSHWEMIPQPSLLQKHSIEGS